MTVPIVAKGTRSPGFILNAPQQICSASPSPRSTSTSWIRSAAGWGRVASTRATTIPGQRRAYDFGPLHHQAEERKGACDIRRSALDGREVT